MLFVWAEFIRGIPLIFVIFWLYFLLPVVFGSSMPGALTVILALAWFTSAAVMHSTLAGIESLPTGQERGGDSLGFQPVADFAYFAAAAGMA
ncbi:amino ABC transporter, permease protein, 3-TM region, His/Glu/Gln/Arg/opine family [Ewingella americana]|uniref:Amino ABC transporter, permease protein, 3-TM region, His/Glu/Gln/Arg/opine family n=1 Tax=Ewingella americana TaxID=41202 RepID=A0A377NGU0_9GAMM|nr:amino ABC transporter, permease protein, 3-TM region, His/Glu/Gln/Arg/opine family [Ewingella americana]